MREQCLPKCEKRSPQLNQRRFLVDQACLAGQKFALPKSAIHLAVVILDRFMDGHDIKSHLESVCMASLSLASKFDCKETHIPKFRHFKSVLPKPIRAVDFRRLEGLILAYFEWNIFIPTATHYVDL